MIIDKFFHECMYSGEPMKIYGNVDNLLKYTINTNLPNEISLILPTVHSIANSTFYIHLLACL